MTAQAQPLCTAEEIRQAAMIIADESPGLPSLSCR